MSHARRVRFDAARPKRVDYSPTHQNRRIFDRYVPSEDRAWIGWWDGSVFRTAEAVLMNISKGGAMVESDVSPPRRSPVWVCLEGPRRTEWVQGKVLEVTKDKSGAPQSRIMFDDICPYAFFEVAVYGWQAAREHPIMTPDSEGESSDIIQPEVAMMMF